MKITTEYDEYQTDVIEIVSAQYMGDLVIQIKFNDSVEKLVDFKAFLKKSLHPTVKQYLEESKFKQFKIVDGNLNWNDFEMIFPVYDLYRGHV